MAKLVNYRSKKVGLPPGTAVHVGPQRTEPVKITVIDYNEHHYRVEQIDRPEQCFELKSSDTVTWINVDGVHNTQIIEELGEGFGLHPLVIEDIVNTTQRPKCEDYEDFIFLVLKMLTYDEQSRSIQSEHISLILGDGFVISFQEHSGDVFEQIRDRIKHSKGRIRKMGCDYLVYCLVDAIVDGYFRVLENLGELIEELEEKLILQPDEDTLRNIRKLKTELLFLRRSVWPLREVISFLQRSESKLVTKNTTLYLRDVYDHTIQVIETLEGFRDVATGMLDIYLSSLSNRMNAVMKMLTVIATIFIPLSFFAGVYGMNFEHMPELRWWWSYPIGFWLAVVVVISIMLYYFKRKKWL